MEKTQTLRASQILRICKGTERFTIVPMMKNKLRDRVLFGLIMELQDGQILNYMSEMPVDELVHMASIMREIYVATDEIRFRQFGEAALHHLNHLGITLVEDIF